MNAEQHLEELFKRALNTEAVVDTATLALEAKRFVAAFKALVDQPLDGKFSGLV